MKKPICLALALILPACTIAIHDPVRFEKEATIRIDKVYNAPYNELYNCLVGSTNVPVANHLTKDGAYYRYPGFMKIDFLPLAKNKTRVLARSVGSYAKADEFVAFIEKACLPPS